MSHMTLESFHEWLHENQTEGGAETAINCADLSWLNRYQLRSSYVEQNHHAWIPLMSEKLDRTLDDDTRDNSCKTREWRDLIAATFHWTSPDMKVNRGSKIGNGDDDSS